MRCSARSMALVLALVALGGCSTRPAAVSTPDWDPDESAEQALASLDTDGDGLLSLAELGKAPGLKSCAATLDTDGDSKLSGDEIAARIQLYRDMAIGFTIFRCYVTHNKKPLVGATVRLVPEPFLEGVTETASGVTKTRGSVQLVAEGSDRPAARIGMYRVEITSPDVDIPAKYNTETILGVEIPPKPDASGTSEIVFDVSSK